MQTNLYDELWDRVNHYSDATLLTLEVDGTLRADQIDLVHPDYDGTLWFFSAPYRPCLRNIEASPEICINYSDEQHYELASLSGSAKVMRDPAVKQAKWAVMSKLGTASLRSWQEATLVQVAVDYAEYWDPYGNNLASFSAPTARPHTMHSQRFARGGMSVAFTPARAALSNRA